MINHVVLQRSGFSDADIRALKEGYKAVWLRKQNTAEALTALEKSEHAANPHVAKFITFIRASERGITK